MEFSAQIDFPAPPSVVAEMFATRDYVLEKVAESGAVGSAVEVVGSAEGAFTVRSSRRLPADDIPESFRRLVGSGVEIHLAEAWEAPRPDGTRHGTIALEVGGAPVRVTGTLRLSPAPAGSTQHFAGDIRAAVPLLGRSIEKAVAGSVDRVIAVERRVGHRWLAG